MFLVFLKHFHVEKFAEIAPLDNQVPGEFALTLGFVKVQSEFPRLVSLADSHNMSLKIWFRNLNKSPIFTPVS